ncbi:MAG: hypothetical protein M1142_02720 [Patescibacteria group bacterium]|nr:hypothetical protein [Patescibacteria group bacterium]
MLVFTPLLLTGLVKAADLEISCSGSDKDCSKSTDASLFSATDGLWFPGKTVSKIISLKNDSGADQVISVQGIRRGRRDGLGNVLYLTFANNQTSQIVWQGTLTRLDANKLINLGSLAAGDSLEVKTSLGMLKTASADFENQKTTFDLTFNFRSDSEKNNKTEERKNEGRVLGQSTEATPESSWISKIFTAIHGFFSRIFSVFNVFAR